MQSKHYKLEDSLHLEVYTTTNQKDFSPYLERSLPLTVFIFFNINYFF